MNKITLFIRKEKILIFILFIASVLRFYNYPNRWGLAYDQAWFAVISRHAIETFQLPLLGPFASGGPFQTGGEWFWIVMAGIALNPFWILSPWIFITILSIFQVFLLFILGKDLLNRKFGYLVTLLGAVSTSQTLQATNLTNQMTASLCTTLFLIFVVRYIKNGNPINLFLQGFFLSLSAAIHLQGVLLFPALLLSILFTKSYSLKKLIFIFLGLFLPWIPVLAADLQNNLTNTKNMLSYFVQPQSQIPYEVLGRRWLTYAGVYLPNAWARIIGGFMPLGYLLIVAAGIYFVWNTVKKKLRKEWWIIFLSTGIIFILLRYIRTPLYENYTTFIHPFVLLIAAIIVSTILKKKKRIGYTLLFIIVTASVLATILDVKNSSNYTSIQSNQFVNALKNKYPGEKFSVYDYRFGFRDKSMPLVYFLQTEGLISVDGRRVGLVVATEGAQIKFKMHKTIFGDIGGYQLFDLTASSDAQLLNNEWASLDPARVYDSVQYWYKK